MSSNESHNVYCGFLKTAAADVSFAVHQAFGTGTLDIMKFSRTRRVCNRKDYIDRVEYSPKYFDFTFELVKLSTWKWAQLKFYETAKKARV